MRKFCGHCYRTFKASRYDAAWCSPRCRVAHHRRMRNAGVTDARVLVFDDGIKKFKATLAGVDQLYELSTCAGWSPSQEAAFKVIRKLLENLIAQQQASRDSCAAGGEPVDMDTCNTDVTDTVLPGESA